MRLIGVSFHLQKVAAERMVMPLSFSSSIESIVAPASVFPLTSWIALIFPLDRILDMCRTVVNVTGDGTVSALVAQSEGELNPGS